MTTVTLKALVKLADWLYLAKNSSSNLPEQPARRNIANYLCINVVHELRDVGDMEDVEVEQVIVDQLSKHRLAYNNTSFVTKLSGI